jgi:hypothetical protein
MEQQTYAFELPDGRIVIGTQVIQRRGDGAVHVTFLTDGRVDGEPIDDVELERLARVHAGFH